MSAARTGSYKRAASAAGDRRIRWWAALAIAGCIAVAIAHLAVLWLGGHDAQATPISRLSRGTAGHAHSLGLLAFAGAHGALAAALRALDAGGWMWRWGLRGLILNAALLVGIAVYFAVASDEQLLGARANDPLSVLASLTGVVMGLLAPGWKRIGTGVARFNLACLFVWIALVPLVLLVDANWLGAYERLVGAIFVLWIAGLATGAVRAAVSR